jgi:hypothetical protein
MIWYWKSVSFLQIRVFSKTLNPTKSLIQNRLRAVFQILPPSVRKCNVRSRG